MLLASLSHPTRAYLLSTCYSLSLRLIPKEPKLDDRRLAVSQLLSDMSSATIGRHELLLNIVDLFLAFRMPCGDGLRHHSEPVSFQ